MLTPEAIQTFKEAMLRRTSGYNLVRTLEGMGYIRDGVYDITGIEYVSIRVLKLNGNINYNSTDEELTAHTDKVIDFMTRFPDCVLADAYQTEHPFLFSRMPTTIVNYMGSGFNHGANNIIPNCPTSILIVAEDD